MLITQRWDMRLTDRELLIALSKLDKPTSQNDIAEGLGCHPKSVSRAIKRLRAKGYIQPLGDGRDKPYTGYIIYYDKLPESLKLDLPAKSTG